MRPKGISMNVSGSNEEMMMSEVERLREALKPFAALQLPKRRQGNAAYYSLFHADIERAKDALAKDRLSALPGSEK
jgi:hypothetical protein